MARRKAPIIPDELLDQLLAGRDPHSALGQGGLLDELKRALAERALNTEMDCHLDGEAAEGRSNSRNGYGRKTVLTETGKLPIAVPRDRLARFEPHYVSPRDRLLGRRGFRRERGKHRFRRMGDHGKQCTRRPARRALALFPVADGLHGHAEPRGEFDLGQMRAAAQVAHARRGRARIHVGRERKLLAVAQLDDPPVRFQPKPPHADSLPARE